MVNNTYNSAKGMIIKLQQLKGKTKLKFHQNTSNYYDSMIVRMDEDSFAGNARVISKIYHEVINLLKFLQTKPQVNKMNRNFYDLYYTVF